MFTFYGFFFFIKLKDAPSRETMQSGPFLETCRPHTWQSGWKGWRLGDALTLLSSESGFYGTTYKAPSPAEKFAELLLESITATLTPSVRLLLSMLDWRPEPLCLSERRYGQVRVQVTSAWLCQFVCVCVCVCVWQVQSPLILDPTVVSINHHDNRVRQGWSRWDEALRFPAVCAFDCQGQSSVALPVFHTRTIFSCLPMSAD